MNKLTFKQKKFVQLYDGNATRTAIKAGYSPKTAYSIGQENLKKPEVLEQIHTRNEKENTPKIASRQERQVFWTDIMFDDNVEILIRLKASELLGKSEADFTVKVETGVIDNFAERLAAARKRAAAALKEEYHKREEQKSEENKENKIGT